ncbi:peptide-N4-(N-acetyl-beta- glucosaminyl)asparagine amidase [Dinochytrium kinnereticum]|nr:peptide-N4-(N-acetyl-beta- glucosaminyl)asparagine amidase [Dinochytrium kinnereticum]
MSANQQSSLLLKRQLNELKKNPVEGFSAGLTDENNIYEWEATLSFPPEYPLLPPKMKFVTEMWHPNVYTSGDVCISILHAPGEDAYGYEDAGERWLPVHTVESIVLSVISMLSSPNDQSPANLEAAKEWRDQFPVFKKKVQRIVRRSLDAIIVNIRSIIIINVERYIELRKQNGTNPDESQFFAAEAAFWPKVDEHVQRFKRYLNDELQDLAREAIPVDLLHEEASRRTKMNSKLSEHDALILSLLRWFKFEYMKWVDSPLCPNCNRATKFQRHEPPSSEDIIHEGTRREVYICENCNLTTPFVRYEGLRKLMETRRGRCGEWANLFTLFCLAMGFETRYVLDFTDHLISLNPVIVHLDPSEGEGSYDQPLLYEKGWKKPLSFIFAFGEYEVVDVISRYSRDRIGVLLRRNTIRENWLAKKLEERTKSLRQNLTASALQELLDRDVLEREELVNPPKRAAKESEMMGRQSGSKDWRVSRGEIGRQVPAYSSSTKSISSGGKNSIILTESLPDQKGGAWIPVDLHLSMQVEFCIRITPPARSNGADGMALVFQGEGEAVLGQGGCHMGYAGIPHSLAIEFDTYRSQDTCSDPAGDHVSVQSRGPQPNSAHHAFSMGCTSSVPSLATGKPLWVRVVYQLASGIEVAMADAKPISDDDFNVILHIPVDILKTIAIAPGRKTYIGFTAATGGLHQRHEVLEWTVFRIQNS